MIYCMYNQIYYENFMKIGILGSGVVGKSLDARF